MNDLEKILQSYIDNVINEQAIISEANASSMDATLLKPANIRDARRIYRLVRNWSNYIDGAVDSSGRPVSGAFDHGHTAATNEADLISNINEIFDDSFHDSVTKTTLNELVIEIGKFLHGFFNGCSKRNRETETFADNVKAHNPSRHPQR